MSEPEKVSWRLHDDDDDPALVLDVDGREVYDVPLDRCTTDRAVFDWAAQLRGKWWGNAECLGEFLVMIDHCLGLEYLRRGDGPLVEYEPGELARYARERLQWRKAVHDHDADQDRHWTEHNRLRVARGLPPEMRATNIGSLGDPEHIYGQKPAPPQRVAR